MSAGLSREEPGAGSPQVLGTAGVPCARPPRQDGHRDRTTRQRSAEPRPGLCASRAACLQRRDQPRLGAKPGPLSPATKEFRKSNLFPDYSRRSLTVEIPADTVRAFMVQNKSRPASCLARRPPFPASVGTGPRVLHQNANKPETVGAQMSSCLPIKGMNQWAS